MWRSRRLGFAKARAVERMPMERIVLLVIRGLGCVLLDWITCCACFFLIVVNCLDARCFLRNLLINGLCRVRDATNRRRDDDCWRCCCNDFGRIVLLDGAYFVIVVKLKHVASGVLPTTRMIVSSRNSRRSADFLCRLVGISMAAAALKRKPWWVNLWAYL